MMSLRACVAFALLLSPAVVRAQVAAPAVVVTPTPDDQRRNLALDAKQVPLGGVIKDNPAWTSYKQRFVTASGRVVDTGNDYISHSEGQGYGLLLAVAAADRPSFDRIWGWTRANLMVRDDELLAWRWQPNARPAVADMNDASDGDLLVAWALTEAAELWGDASYRASARRIAVEIGRKVIIFKTDKGALLLPAVSGFAKEDRSDGPVLNLSYYVFPALQRLQLVAPDLDWAGVLQTGLNLLKATRFGPARLPSDWVAMNNGSPGPADGFPPLFSYNAVRIPLYMIWAGVGDWDNYRDFYGWASKRQGALAVVDVNSGAETDRFGENGYAAIGSLLTCAIDQTPTPPDFKRPRESENYYPATLHMLSITAAAMRYPSCLKG